MRKSITRIFTHTHLFLDLPIINMFSIRHIVYSYIDIKIHKFRNDESTDNLLQHHTKIYLLQHNTIISICNQNNQIHLFFQIKRKNRKKI